MVQSVTMSMEVVLVQQDIVVIGVEMFALQEPMGISVLKNAAVKMAHVPPLMDHVIVLLVTLVHTVTSPALPALLD